MDLLDLAKTGIAALSTYASYKDQKKKNELQQQQASKVWHCNMTKKTLHVWGGH